MSIANHDQTNTENLIASSGTSDRSVHRFEKYLLTLFRRMKHPKQCRWEIVLEEGIGNIIAQSTSFKGRISVHKREPESHIIGCLSQHCIDTIREIVHALPIGEWDIGEHWSLTSGRVRRGPEFRVPNNRNAAIEDEIGADNIAEQCSQVRVQTRDGRLCVLDGVLAVGVIPLVDTIDDQPEKRLVVVSAYGDGDEVRASIRRVMDLGVITLGRVGAGARIELKG